MNILTTTGWHHATCSTMVTTTKLTGPRRSQPHKSCKRNDTEPDCNSAMGQHCLENDQCALNYDNKRFSILATARSSFHLNLWRLLISRLSAWCYPGKKSWFILSNSFDNRGVLIWLRFLQHFAIAKSFFGAIRS